MKKISIIGAGVGPATITREAEDAIQAAEVLLGARRMLDMFSMPDKQAIAAFSPDEVRRAIDESSASRFAIIVSGDTGFYSAAEGLCSALCRDEYQLRVLPGISSLSCLFARLRRPWQDVALISCHGRDTNIVDTVRRNRLTFALTGANANELAKKLTDAGFGSLSATVGENVGADNECIYTLSVAEMEHTAIAPLCVVLVDNPRFDSRTPTGIPDTSFIRSDIPMTKSEVRAVIMSRLAIHPHDICWDIGCGTGSVTVEMALSAYRGHVYAIDKNEAAAALTQDNCAAFHIGNVTVQTCSAPSALSSLPMPDVVFIGGSGGSMQAVIKHVAAINPKARIAVTAIAPESLCAALTALEECGIKADAVQVSIARAQKAAGLHMLMAQNPIFVITGGCNG